MKGIIYIILNTVNQKYYLGSTTEYECRKYTHIWKLNKGIHHCIHLQNAWNKYGEKSFEFKILYESVNLREDEQQELNSIDWSKVYNISKRSVGGDIIQSHPNKDDIIKRMIATKKSMNLKPNNRIKISINSIVYDSYHDASKELNVPIVTLRYRCLSNNIKYKDYFVLNNPKDASTLYNQGEIQGHQIICEGTQFPSYASAAKYYNLSITAIINRVKSPNYPEFYKK